MSDPQIIHLEKIIQTLRMLACDSEPHAIYAIEYVIVLLHAKIAKLK